MLDIKFIRENPKLVEEKAKQKGYDVNIQQLFKVDEERRKLIEEVDKLRSERKKAAEARDTNEGQALKVKIRQLEDKLKKLQGQFEGLMRSVPNLPLEGVPIGDDLSNKSIKKIGTPRKFDFAPKDHLELGEELNLIDIPRASKVSGTRFAYLKNELAILEIALINFAFEKLLKEKFEIVIPPSLIRFEITKGLGYWDGTIDENHTSNENYYLVHDPHEKKENDDSRLYLIGTGEHVIVPMYKDEIISEKDLPKKIAAFSPSYRREAGTYGKDTRGILRVHQFDKVEMVEFVKPDDDKKERKKLLEIAESLVKALEIPYQLVRLASRDLPFPTAETIDIECWIPSQNKYRETHSISTTTDFQARRLNIKYSEANQTKFVHILNATAFAIGRTIITIMENYQQKDGSILVPKVLQKYTNFAKIPA